MDMFPWNFFLDEFVHDHAQLCVLISERILGFNLLFRTPPPPVQAIPIDPLRVRLFPDESDEEIRTQTIDM